jgi:RNA polymerase sigma-70 factor (ECF subfamily)
MDEARRAVERVARESFGKLVAFLSARSGDVAGAEDALADALLAALRRWPIDGIPDLPEAWLIRVARRRLIDAGRRGRFRAEVLRALHHEANRSSPRPPEEPLAIPDDRLKLLFLCAHPAIDPAARTPLMLQLVLGLDAATIASAFLVSPTGMGQRLVRAKARIRDASPRVELPEPEDLPDRLDAVLGAIYAAFGTGWDDGSGADPRRSGLADEAIWLGRVLVLLMPTEPEALGLLALMLHCEARRPARRSADGSYVPLGDQDPALWSLSMIAEADRLLLDASRHRRPGRFQLEAAIQSAHAARRSTGSTDWRSIALLYEGLVRLAPTVGALVGRAAAMAEALGPADALASLDALPADLVRDYQPFWALRAHLLPLLNRPAEARVALDRALGLTEDPAVRAFLLRRRPPG